MSYRVESISAQEYKSLYPSPLTAYDSVDFALLNSDRLSGGEASIEFLNIVKEDGHPFMGLIVGVEGDEAAAPFSAPFSLPTLSRKVMPTLQQSVTAIAALRDYHRERGRRLVMTLPPELYSPTFVAYLSKSLDVNGGEPLFSDLSQYYPVELSRNYIDHLNRSGRHNLMVAEASGLHFEVLQKESWERAYDVIAINRAEKGYPLHMDRERVRRTIELVEAKFFVVSDEVGEDVAAAQLFRVTGSVWQVIYWGHKQSSTAARPMSLLSKGVFEYMGETGACIVDVGPSSSHGEPDYGLSEFKASLGCQATLKKRYRLG